MLKIQNLPNNANVNICKTNWQNKGGCQRQFVTFPKMISFGGALLSKASNIRWMGELDFVTTPSPALEQVVAPAPLDGAALAKCEPVLQ